MRASFLVVIAWLASLPAAGHAQHAGNAPEDGDAFGEVVATGDFDGDGFADLAVSAPDESFGIDNVGLVHVVYGSPISLTETRRQLFTQLGADDYFGSALAAGDFDGDGADDLAVGNPWKAVAGVASAGTVFVQYGELGVGLTTAGNQEWTQDTPGIDGTLDVGAKFGEALAVGDFDGDAFADLAVGAYGEDIDGIKSAGAVHVIYGSASGLSADGDHLFHQDTGKVEDKSEDGDWYGKALAAGDFDGDGIDDLAVTVQHEDLGGVADTGAVNVLFGSPVGLTDDADQLWAQSAGSIPGDNDESDHFGTDLAAGDFDGDGVDDLAIGVPNQSVGALVEAGIVHVLFGAVGVGLTDVDNEVFVQGARGLKDTPGPGESFGRELEAADFDGDGVCDLAIGLYQDVVDPVQGPLEAAGAVHVLLGVFGVGLTSANDQLFHRATPGVSGVPEVADFFGWDLAGGDFDGDGLVDLAIGVRDDNLDNVEDAGSVHVLHGAAAGGLTPAGDQIWTQGP